MEFDFETLVERSGANLKLMMTPPEVVKAGNISLDGAEPDFKSAPVIEEAVIRFAKNGLYGFTLPDEAYKSAVTKWMQMSRKTQIKPEWIVTTLGTIYSLATTIRLVCTDPDDGIIVTTPVYNRYRQAADRLNKKTVECPLIYDMKRFVKCFFELLTQIIVKVRKCKVQRVCVLHFQLAGWGGCFFLMKLYH